MVGGAETEAGATKSPRKRPATNKDDEDETGVETVPKKRPAANNREVLKKPAAAKTKASKAGFESHYLFLFGTRLWAIPQT